MQVSVKDVFIYLFIYLNAGPSTIECRHQSVNCIQYMNTWEEADYLVPTLVWVFTNMIMLSTVRR